MMVSCQQPDAAVSAPDFLLILDYVTDAVLEKSDIGGRIYVSPDARHVVVLARNGKTVSAYKVSDEGNFQVYFSSVRRRR